MCGTHHDDAWILISEAQRQKRQLLLTSSPDVVLSSADKLKEMVSTSESQSNSASSPLAGSVLKSSKVRSLI